VTKPFHRRELLARVRSLVRVRDLQDSLAEQNASLERALSELKKTQEFLVRNERLAAVGELAAGIAHEVNNPVNFALNASRALSTSVKEIAKLAQRMAELEWRDRDKLELQLTELVNLQEELGAEDIPNTIVELSAIVSDGLSRTSGLVRDLMNFASPSRSLLDPVDLRQGLVSTVHLLKQVLNQKRARVKLDIQKDLPEVAGDAASLNQIFLNLLKNAAEAESDGGVTIRVESRVDNEAVSLTFSDDGPGMSLEEQNRLFEPFFSTKPAGSGTGLGLSISRQIAETHRGTLTVESTPGNGTTFTLRLPLSK
jgi:two-component system NtrC family sensor kinase